MIEKKLTIKELFNELKALKSRLIKLANKYNRTLINVSAVTYKDIITKGGIKGDIMLNKVIKKEELDHEFDIVLASYNEYREKTIDEIRKMLNEKPVEECIAYFRDELHWKWKDICKLFSYGRSQASKKYADYKKRTTSDTIGH